MNTKIITSGLIAILLLSGIVGMASADPGRAFGPVSHDFGDMYEGETGSTYFEIWNCGTGTLTYSLSESCSWVDVRPTSGSSTGEHDTITVDIDTTGLSSAGYHSSRYYSCNIYISSNAIQGGYFSVGVNIIPSPLYVTINPVSEIIAPLPVESFLVSSILDSILSE